MGGYNNSIPKLTFVLRMDQKSLKKTTYPIYFRYCYKGRRVEKTTNIAIEEKEWDKIHERITNRNKNCNQLNTKLDFLRNKYDGLMLKYCNLHKSINIKIIKEIIEKGENYFTTIPDDIDFFVEAFKLQENLRNTNKLSYSTYKNHINQLDIFRNFIKNTKHKETILFSELNKDIIQEFITYKGKEAKNKPESINKALTPIKKAIESSMHIRPIQKDLIAFVTGDLFYLSINKDMIDEDKNIKYLTEDQLRQIIELYPKLKYDKSREYIEIFLFVVHVGLRVSDIITLKWDQINFKKKEIKKILYKGKKAITIPLIDAAISILNKWRDRKINKVFVFNLLPENFDLSNIENLDKMRINKNRSIANSLNEIGNKIGLEFNLSMHIGRHTFAVLAINHNMSLNVLSKLLGHADSSVTERVYAKLLPQKIDDEVRSKMKSNFTPF